MRCHVFANSPAFLSGLRFGCVPQERHIAIREIVEKTTGCGKGMGNSSCREKPRMPVSHSLRLCGLERAKKTRKK
jgi:hypothetical protein